MVYTPPTSPSRKAFEPLRLLPPTDAMPDGCAFAQDLLPGGCLSQSSSASTLEDNEILTPPTPTAHDLQAEQPPLEAPCMSKHARSFSHDDILQSAPSTHCPGSPRPRLHRRGHSRGSNPIIRLSPQSPDFEPTPPAVHEIALDHRDDVFSSPGSSSQSSPSTVWPQGDPKQDALSPSVSPTAQRTFPKTNALNLEGVPPAAPAEATPKVETVDDGSDLRVHQRSASSTGIYGPLSHLEKRGPLIRKKSGEPVRSSLKGSPLSRKAELGLHLEIKSRRGIAHKSAPSTPLSKSVHFSSELEQVKHFMAQQRPTAVSRQGSPDETTEEESESYPFPSMSAIHKVTLQLPNWTKPAAITPSESRDVLVTNIMLHSDTKTLRGSVAVRNIAFHKRVAVRFTLDEWQTTSEVAADYAKNINGGSFDEWAFAIKLSDIYARIEDRKLVFAVRYCTDGREIWDNNGGRNYVATFKKQSAGSSASSSAPTKVRRPASQRAASNYEWSASINEPSQSEEHAQTLKTSLVKLLNDEPVPEPKMAAKGSKVLSSRYDFSSAPKSHPAKTSSLNDLAPIIGGGNQSPMISPRTLSSSVPRSTAPVTVSSAQPDVMRPLFTGGYPFPMAPQPQSAASSLYADATDDSDFGSDLNFTRTERFNSFPPTSYSLRPRIDDGDKEDSEHVEHSTVSPFAGGKRPSSPPPARDPLPDLESSPSSDASYSSPLSPPTSLDSPNLHQLQKSIGSSSVPVGQVTDYAGFLEKFCFFTPTSSYNGVNFKNEGYTTPRSQWSNTVPDARSAFAKSRASSGSSTSTVSPHDSPGLSFLKPQPGLLV